MYQGILLMNIPLDRQFSGNECNKTLRFCRGGGVGDESRTASHRQSCNNGFA